MAALLVLVMQHGVAALGVLPLRGGILFEMRRWGVIEGCVEVETLSCEQCELRVVECGQRLEWWMQLEEAVGVEDEGGGG